MKKWPDTRVVARLLGLVRLGQLVVSPIKSGGRREPLERRRALTPARRARLLAFHSRLELVDVALGLAGQPVQAL